MKIKYVIIKTTEGYHLEKFLSICKIHFSNAVNNASGNNLCKITKNQYLYLENHPEKVDRIYNFNKQEYIK